MQPILIFHLQAPLMSFGGPQVDQIGPTGRFPTVSQVTGLLGNALGYRHGDFGRLQSLQDRLSLASALVCDGEEVEDYQTVDLGQAHLRSPAWTTRGYTEHRAGSPEARYGTHIRFRRYRADANVLVAISLSPANEVPTVSDLSAALELPARPLFIGRKSCLPSVRMFIGIVERAKSLTCALASVPVQFPDRWSEIFGVRNATELEAEWPVTDDRLLSVAEQISTYRVTDQRDWRNQLHGGERVVMRGRLALHDRVSEDDQ